MARTMRTVTLQIAVEVGDSVSDQEVVEAINAALDEPPCDWGLWTVGAAHIIDAE